MPDEMLRTKALKYFLEHHAKQYGEYKPQDFAQVAFVPTRPKGDQEKGGKSLLGKPTEVMGSTCQD
jgi:hypothetical protein